MEVNPFGEHDAAGVASHRISSNDLPGEFNYDFQAPLGEYGQVHESYRKTKLLHLFQCVRLRPREMVPVGPKHVPKDPGDTSVPRVAVRSRGETGFIFVNNYIRQFQCQSGPDFRSSSSFQASRYLFPRHL